MKWLVKDWGIKLIALALAVGLWYYAVGEESIEVKRSVPLELQVKNPQMSVLKTSVKNVLVTLSVPRSVLSDLTTKEIKAVHSIGPEVKTAGDYSFRLETGEIKVPTPQFRVVKIFPEIIQVTMDEQIVQKLKIEPDFLGEPAFGYKVQDTEIKIDPNAVLVEGPKGQLEKIDSVKTEKIDLVGRIRSFRRTLQLALPEGLHALSESAVEVFVPLKEEFSEKQFDNIPVKVLKSADRSIAIEISPSVVSFSLKGSRQQLEKLLPEDILAYADVTTLDRGTHEVAVKLVLPGDVSLKEDLKVQVTISKPGK